MILKTFITFLLFMGCYNILITKFSTPNASQNQNQDNLIKAQHYMFSNHTPKNIIVGTSLSCHIKSDSLKDFFNLAFNGSSIYDGLNVIVNSSKYPKIVYIESNLYLNNKSVQLSNQLYNFFPYYSSKIFPIFRIVNQPIGKLIYLTNNIGNEFVISHNNFMEKLRTKINYEFPSNIKSLPTQESVNIFNIMLKEQKKNYSKIPNLYKIKRKTKELKKIIKTLKLNGVKVVFFEMPINSALVNLPLSKTIRQKLYSSLKDEVYFLDQDYSKYVTSDGIHLNEQESIKYTHFFKKQIKSACSK